MIRSTLKHYAFNSLIGKVCRNRNRVLQFPFMYRCDRNMTQRLTSFFRIKIKCYKKENCKRLGNDMPLDMKRYIRNIEKKVINTHFNFNLIFPVSSFVIQLKIQTIASQLHWDISVQLYLAGALGSFCSLFIGSLSLGVIFFLQIQHFTHMFIYVITSK